MSLHVMPLQFIQLYTQIMARREETFEQFVASYILSTISGPTIITRFPKIIFRWIDKDYIFYFSFTHFFTLILLPFFVIIWKLLKSRLLCTRVYLVIYVCIYINICICLYVYIFIGICDFENNNIIRLKVLSAFFLNIYVCIFSFKLFLDYLPLFPLVFFSM